MSRKNLQNKPTPHDGDGFITVNGSVYPAFEYAKMSLNAETITDSKRFLNQRVTQNAARGLSLNGSLSYYHCTQVFIDAITDFKNGGEYPEIALQGWAGLSGIGRCEILATGVILKNIGLLNLDDSSDSAAVIDTDITANDYDVISKFNK